MVLFIGDPHVQVSNIKDSNSFMELALQAAEKNKVDFTLIAGDLFHNHAVLRVEVVSFWRNWVLKFSEKGLKLIILRGNHDAPHDNIKYKEMSALDSLVGISDLCQIIDTPKKMGEFGFIPYLASSEEFVAEATKLYSQGAKYLFCHQTFNGSVFENGFYAPEGIEPDSVNMFKEVVSGHIHKTQKFSNIFYPGTPKWDSMSDANENKAIWLLDFNKEHIPIYTDSVIEPIKKITIYESDGTFGIKEKLGKKTIVELVGTSVWIGSLSKKIKGECRIVGRPTDIKVMNKNSKSKNIFEFIETFDLIKSELHKKQVSNYLKGLWK